MQESRRELQGSADAAINFRLELLASIDIIMVDHYQLFEFACKININVHHNYDTGSFICYVALVSPPRHQHVPVVLSF